MHAAAPANASRAMDRLWRPDATMEALLGSMPSALAILDPHGHIVFHNQAWTALGARTATYGDLGTLVTSSDREGTPYLRRLAALDGPLAMPAHRIARAAHDILAGRSSEARTPYRIHRPEGEQPFEAHLIPIPTAKATYVALQHIDQGDHEHASDAEAVALEKALQVEEAASRQRRLVRRIQQLGRDLHTPITPVRLELHLLRSGAFGTLSPAQAKAVDVAYRNVERWSEREGEFQGMPNEPSAPAVHFDLAAFVVEAAEARRTQALKQGVRLAFPAGIPILPVHASPDDVRDLIDRLLDHALAASPADSVVTLEVRSVAGEAQVAVIDSGPGMTARELRTCFEPWGGKRPEPGASLSLHVARLHAEKAGGRAWAECDGPETGLLLGFAIPLLAGGGFKAADGSPTSPLAGEVK